MGGRVVLIDFGSAAAMGISGRVGYDWSASPCDPRYPLHSALHRRLALIAIGAQSFAILGTLSPQLHTVDWRWVRLECNPLRHACYSHNPSRNDGNTETSLNPETLNPRYAPPEKFIDEGQWTKFDLFSIGLILVR